MEHVSSRARLTTLLSAVTIGFILRQLLRSPPSKLIVDPSKVGRQLGDGFDVDEYDVIIVGGGTAGCVLAARLSEDPNVRVLVLEAGASGRSLLFSRIPIGFIELLHSKHAYEFWTEPQQAAHNKKKFWPRAKLLGGCSSINAQMAQYGAPQDFDEWARVIGDDSWSWENFRNYFKKFENYQSDPEYPEVNASAKGSNGPVRVGYFSTITNISKEFVKACTRIGIPYSPDFNTNPDGTQGVNRVMTYIDETRTRVSAESAYLTKEVLARKNLRVVLHATVNKVVIENLGGTLRATGVEFSCSKDGPIFRARSRREVIVAGGALHSPQILMLSGVGPLDELRKAGIPVKHHLPGVGSHLVDHPVIDVAYKDKYNVSPKHLSPRSLFEFFKLIGSVVQYFTTRRGPLALNSGEAAAFCRSDDPVLFPKQEHAAIQDSTSGASSPDLEIFVTPFAYKEHGGYMYPMHTFGIHATLLRPLSTGYVRLKSSDPRDHPIVDPQYLTAPEDVERLVRGLRLIMNISKTEPLASHLDHTYAEPLLDTNMFRKSNKDLEEIVRDRVETLYHPTSTCRMAPLSDGGVVDSHLRVYGVDGLRVCDASIFPKIVSGHTTAAVLATAEHLADIIKSEVSGRATI